MRRKIYAFRKIMWLSFFAFFIVILTACENSNQDSSAQNAQKTIQLRFAVPQSFTGPLISQLQAKVALDGGVATALTVNADNTISGQIANVPAGSHTMVVTYYVMIGSSEVDLATVSKSLSVSKGQTTTVTIADSDLNRNIDSDGDNFTNLTEVRMGFDALNRLDKPAGDPPTTALGNGVFSEVASTNYDINATIGEPINGASASTSFSVTHGFGGY